MLIVTEDFPPNVYGGVGVYVYNLIKYFIIDEWIKNIDIAVLTVEGSTPQGKDFIRLPIHIIKLKCKFHNFPLSFLEFSYLANKFIKRNWHKYDLIHDNTNTMISEHIPVIATVHTTQLQEHEYYAYGGFSFIKWLLMRIVTKTISFSLEKKALRKSSFTIAVSNELKLHLLRKFNLKDRLTHISCGVDGAIFKKKVLFGTKRYDLTYVGRFAPRKGVFFLCKALDLIKDRNLNVLFCGPSYDFLYDYTRKWSRKSHHKIFFSIEVGYNEMTDIYNETKILILPSLYESFGLVLAESLCCGTPIIATKVGGIPEVVEDGKDGILVPPKQPTYLAEAIRSLLLNEKLQNEMGCYGMARIREKFNWHITSEKTYEIYQSVF